MPQTDSGYPDFAIQIVSIKSIGRDVLRALVFGIDVATGQYQAGDS